MGQGTFKKDNPGDLGNTTENLTSGISHFVPGNSEKVDNTIKATANQKTATSRRVHTLLKETNSDNGPIKVPIIGSTTLGMNQEVTIYPINAFSRDLLERSSFDFLFFELPNGDIISVVLTAKQNNNKIYTIRHGILPLYNVDGELAGIMQFPPFCGITLARLMKEGDVEFTSPIIKQSAFSEERNLTYTNHISWLFSGESIREGKKIKITPSQLGEIQLRDKESFPNLTCTVQHIGVSTIGKEIFYVDVSDQDGNSIFQCEYRKYRESNTESPLFDKRILYIGGMLNGSGDEELLKKVTCWLLVHSEDLGMPEDTLLLFFRDDTHKYTSKIRTIGYYKNKYLNY